MGRKSRLSLVEALALSFTVGAAVFLATKSYYSLYLENTAYLTSHSWLELSPFLAKFKEQPRYSRHFEEWIIRDYFQDKRNGVFLDVGANHFQKESNTYYLETVLGWSGIAVDALPEFGPEYATHRPRTKFVAMFASDVEDSTVTFFVPVQNKLVASADFGFTVREGSAGIPRSVPTTTLNAVLSQAQIPRLDLLSMDIELSEPKALAGFDIDRYQPALVCIEGHEEVRQAILNYFADHNYVMLAKYLRIDPHNLYFVPRKSLQPVPGTN